MGHQRLTRRQEMFCEAYWRCRNASLAYREAYSAEGCAAATVHRKAAELMKNGKVRARISELQAIADEEFRFTAHKVVEELAAIAFSDPGDLVDDQGRFRRLQDLPRPVRAAIAHIKLYAHAEGAVVAVRLADKLKALALLLQVVGPGTKPERSGADLSALTDEEIEAELQALGVRTDES